MQQENRPVRSPGGCIMSRFLTLVAVAAAVFAASPASAQDAAADFPTRPVRAVVAVPAGGGVDTVTRMVTEKMQQVLGKPITVENRSGAGGSIAAEYVYSVRARRLYAARLTALADHDQCLSLQEAWLRRDQVRVGRHHVAHSQCAAGQAGFAVQDGAGPDRLRQGQPGQAQLRLAGHRHDIASDHGVVRDPSPAPSSCTFPTRGRRRRSTI